MPSTPLPGPVPKDEHVRRRMETQKRLSTSPELRLRQELHRRGLRYRVELKVPGLHRRTIDIAFTRVKVAVFVDGCFWHRCPEHYVPVKNNSGWWEAKLDANVARDADTTRALEALGWCVVRIWEHVAAEKAADMVEAAVRPQ